VKRPVVKPPVVKKVPLRTDETHFINLPGYPFKPHYLFVQHPDYEPLRMHFLDEGHPDATPVLLLHGCPTWSYLYRKVMAALQYSPHGKHLRLIAPDHIGCGKSDKLLARSDYRYDFYVSSIGELITQLDLRGITLVCQDWGGPIGLRLFSEMPERFARIVTANTVLPNAELPPRGVADWPGDTIRQWVSFTQHASDMPVGQIVQGVCVTPLPADVIAAYDAPFPDARFKQGMLNWPSLIPLAEGYPGIRENRHAWEMLEQTDIPLLTAFSDSDPSTADWETVFQCRPRGAQHLTHVKIKGAGHMLQEDQGEILAKVIEMFIFQ
jgi:haloalkane dehalogenase